MSRFRLDHGQSIDLTVGGDVYLLEALEHPTALGTVHSMEGGKALVYHLRERRAPAPRAAEFALKVMRRRFADPGLVEVCQRLDHLHQWEGLRVCRRRCLSPGEAPAAIAAQPELAFAMLMPWIAGPPWLEIVGFQRALPGRREALSLATRMAQILARLERAGIAHCDLSSSNLILDARDGSPQLIDVEDLFGPGFGAPNAIPLGTAGYQHRESASGQWRADADRFAGAILLSEILAWADPAVVTARHGESYFDPAELQDPASVRFRTLAAAAEAQRPGARKLLEHAWGSAGLAECPRLEEWSMVLQADWVPFPPLELQSPKAIVQWVPNGPMPVAAPRELVSWQPHVQPPLVAETPKGIFSWAPHAVPQAAPDDPDGGSKP